jgi:hypothetical protein
VAVIESDCCEFEVPGLANRGRFTLGGIIVTRTHNGSKF